MRKTRPQVRYVNSAWQLKVRTEAPVSEVDFPRRVGKTYRTGLRVPKDAEAPVFDCSTVTENEHNISTVFPCAMGRVTLVGQTFAA